MARFVMANRRAGLFTKHEKVHSRKALDSSFQTHIKASSIIISDYSGPKETSRRTILLEGEPQEIAAKRSLMPPQVMIEPEILHYAETALPQDLAYMRNKSRSRSLKAGQGLQLALHIRGAGQALSGAEVNLYLRGAYDLSDVLTEITDVNGKVTFTFSDFWQVAAAVISPVGGFWRKLVRGPRDGQTVILRRLPAGGRTAWWHRLHGVNVYNANIGQGVRVGVADTGLGPHPNVAHAEDQGAFIDGGHHGTAGADVDSHGTHVAGIIGARPIAPDELAGIAPGASLYTARVFPPGMGANQGDIANAIDHLSSVNQCDLINLSLGSTQGSEIERDAIIDALERGTICVCAAANDGVEPVNYPAKFDETIAISAIGFNGWAPDGSISALNYPEVPDKYGIDGYFLASFSNFGYALTGAGGGVGIISTVPERFGYTAPYAVMDGTSMASPAACGALAGHLSKRADYLAMPRDITRAQKARAIFRESARDIGLDDKYQGRGVPQVK